MAERQLRLPGAAGQRDVVPMSPSFGLVVAVLAKGLASNDKALKRRFKALCPDGVLIEVPQVTQ